MTVNEEGMPAAKLKEAFSRLEKLIKDQDYAGLEKIMTVYADYRPEAAPAGEQVLPPSPTQPGKIVPLPLQEHRG